MRPTAYLELSTLLEPHWTGLATVTAGIASAAFADDSIDWAFFAHTIPLPRAMVSSMLQSRTGAGAGEQVRALAWANQSLDWEAAATSKALFPYLKTVRGVFGTEAMFIHDLTPLLTPQYHRLDTIRSFADRIAGDVGSSGWFFCNSRSTRDDLVAYLGVGTERTTVVPMGVEIDLFDVSMGQELARSTAPEPYVVVLGTLEPRKNGAIVLQHLVRNPDFAERFRIVFVGAAGWLDERERLMEQVRGTGLPEDRVVFTGYVSEAEKIGLLLNCRFAIYPSLFEGYGLPIAEAAALGKLVVCSDTSSMREVAPEMCSFFDPFDLADFGRALQRAEWRSAVTRTTLSLPDIDARLAARGWDACYRDIAAWVRA